MKIHVFNVDTLPRRVLGRTWPNLGAKSAKNDPKMAPQNDPKSIKKRCPKMIKILIDYKRGSARFGGWPGGLRGALGGKQGGGKMPMMRGNSCLATSSAISDFNLCFESAISDKEAER